MSLQGDTVGGLGCHHSVVVGHGGLSDSGMGLEHVPGITVLSAPPTEPSAIAVLATDFADGTAPPAVWLDRLRERTGLTIAAVGAPATAEGIDPDTAREIERLRSAVDATVVVPPGRHQWGIRSVVTTIHDIVVRPGVINLDPADIRTVLESGEAAVIATGTARATDDVAADAMDAVEDALDASGADIDGLTAVLVNVVGSGDLTLESAVDALDGIRASLPHETVLIWGVAVDESLSGVHAQVVAGAAQTPILDRLVREARQPAGGEGCPRCGGHVAVYSLGDNETAACEDCGYAGISTSL